MLILLNTYTNIKTVLYSKLSSTATPWFEQRMQCNTLYCTVCIIQDTQSWILDSFLLSQAQMQRAKQHLDPSSDGWQNACKYSNLRSRLSLFCFALLCLRLSTFYDKMAKDRRLWSRTFRYSNWTEKAAITQDFRNDNSCPPYSFLNTRGIEDAVLLHRIFAAES